MSEPSTPEIPVDLNLTNLCFGSKKQNPLHRHQPGLLYTGSLYRMNVRIAGALPAGSKRSSGTVEPFHPA